MSLFTELTVIRDSQVLVMNNDKKNGDKLSQQNKQMNDKEEIVQKENEIDPGNEHHHPVQNKNTQKLNDTTSDAEKK